MFYIWKFSTIFFLFSFRLRTLICCRKYATHLFSLVTNMRKWNTNVLQIQSDDTAIFAEHLMQMFIFTEANFPKLVLANYLCFLFDCAIECSCVSLCNYLCVRKLNQKSSIICLTIVFTIASINNVFRIMNNNLRVLVVVLTSKHY